MESTLRPVSDRAVDQADVIELIIAGNIAKYVKYKDAEYLPPLDWVSGLPVFIAEKLLHIESDNSTLDVWPAMIRLRDGIANFGLSQQHAGNNRDSVSVDGLMLSAVRSDHVLYHRASSIYLLFQLS